MEERLAEFLERPWRALAILLPLALLLSLPAVWVHFGGTLLDLLPDRPVARSLNRVFDAVSAQDVDLVMVEGNDTDSTREGATRFAHDIVARPTIATAMATIPVTQDPTASALFRALVTRGDDATMRALEQRFSPEGAQNAALRIQTMAMAPGGTALADQLTRDPYDLAPVLAQRLQHLGAGVRPGADGAIVSPDGRARLIVLRGRGGAFDMKFCDAMGADIRAVAGPIEHALPGVRVRWTGPHAVAPATRDLIRSDLQTSSILASILVSVIFLLSMRRLRALIGVGVPLIIGTAWTTALAAVAMRGLNAITIAFGAIVLGVGMDTGVHLYDRVLTERRNGLPANRAAARALAELGGPVLTAAVTAGAAFASLCASELTALRQLGILAAAGEVLTAIAIVMLTPVLAVLFERGEAPKTKSSERPLAIWAGRLAGAKYLPVGVLAALALVLGSLTLGPAPHLGDSVVLVRPKALEPLQVQEALFKHFGGEPGQLMIVGEADTVEQALRTSEGIERVLTPLQERGTIAGFDTVSALAPSLQAQRERLDRVRAMNPSHAADLLGAALTERGAYVQMFAPGLDALREPLPEPSAFDPFTGAASSLTKRFIAQRHGKVVFLAYVRPPANQHAEAVRADITRAIDSLHAGLELTGYPLLEADVRAALRSDVTRVGGLAFGLVAFLLILALRKPRPVLLALTGVAIEIAALMAFLGLAHVPLDAYNLLAVPVLVGITIDEIVFVLHEYDEAKGTPAERASHAVQGMASATSATAASTAAGFLALAICKFDALRGLGLVAGVGTLLGLVCAIIIVPALSRLTTRDAKA